MKASDFNLKKFYLKEAIVEEQQINEWVWVLPALATAARVGGPALLKLLSNTQHSKFAMPRC